MLWLSDPEKKFQDTITCYLTIHKRDGQQDGRTDRWILHNGIGCAHA